MGKNGTDLLHQLIFSQNKWNKLKKWNTHLSSSSPIIRQGVNLNMYFFVYLRTYQIHRQPLHETWYKISNLIIISSYIVHSENKYGRKRSMDNWLLLTRALNILLPAVFSATTIIIWWCQSKEENSQWNSINWFWKECLLSFLLSLFNISRKWKIFVSQLLCTFVSYDVVFVLHIKTFEGFARRDHYLQKDKSKTLLQFYFESIFLNTLK